MNTTDLILSNGIITTESEESGGGNITIHTDNLLHLTDSIFSAESRSEQLQDSGGNIILDKAYFSILNKSQMPDEVLEEMANFSQF